MRLPGSNKFARFSRVYFCFAQTIRIKPRAKLCKLVMSQLNSSRYSMMKLFVNFQAYLLSFSSSFLPITGFSASGVVSRKVVSSSTRKLLNIG